MPDVQNTEEKMIAGCIANSRKWQEALYRSYFPDCYYMCLRYTRDEDRARMIVNDGLLQVFKKIDSFQKKGSLKAWIKRIVFNTMADYFRKENKYLKMMLFEPAEKTELEEVHSQLYYDDIISLIDDLDYNTREVFKLYAIDGFNHREIGLQLNMSEGNSKWHLHKARKILQEKLRNQAQYRNYG